MGDETREIFFGPLLAHNDHLWAFVGRDHKDATRDIVQLDNSPRYEPIEPGEFRSLDPMTDLLDRDTTDREIEEIRQSVYTPSQDGEVNEHDSDDDDSASPKAAGGLAALWGLLRGFAGTRDKHNANEATSRRTLQ